MPYPDNFDGTKFDRIYGTDIPRPDLRAIVNADVNAAATLRDAAATFLTAIDGVSFKTTEPVPGYGMEDITGMLTDIRDGIDLPAYRVRASAVATDMAMGGDL
jgi:hypothetical protein